MVSREFTGNFRYYFQRRVRCEPGPHPDAACALTAMGVTAAMFPAENGRGVCRRPRVMYGARRRYANAASITDVGGTRR
jgi:hypothetical protein